MRGKSKEEIVEAITAAFHGVILGDGVGPLQGQAMDHYEDTAAAREQDETLDWSTIPSRLLDRCSSSLNFFDPQGMRFHFPAFAIDDLK